MELIFYLHLFHIQRRGRSTYDSSLSDAVLNLLCIEMQIRFWREESNFVDCWMARSISFFIPYCMTALKMFKIEGEKQKKKCPFKYQSIYFSHQINKNVILCFVPDFNDKNHFRYRVSHLKLTKVILLWWRYRLWFLLILWILCVP